jgi:lipooligosaccharide transport system ATP-binding protein
MNAVENAIDVRGLVKRFDGRTVVDQVSMAVRTGEIVGFLGPNGAGKTTTMRMISCTSPPTDGELSVLGLPSERGRDIRRRMGVVPQENNLDEEVSVFDNLLIYARYFDIPRRMARPIAEELLHFVALHDKRDWRIERLSGGMKRRLLIARSLMNEPDVLILDEPTRGIDVGAHAEIIRLIESLCEEGMSLLVISSELEELVAYSHRVIVVRDRAHVAELTGAGINTDSIVRAIAAERETEHAQ